MAVECDGATYHSAQWARERDRLRQGILEGLGWRFYRVWSTDWFRTPEAAKHKLAAALAGARFKASEPAVKPSEEPAGFPISVPSGRQSAPVTPAERHVTLYQEASFRVHLVSTEIHEIPVDKLSSIVARIVLIEAPVHEEEIARRAARLMGKDRAGSRIVSSVRGALRHAAQRVGTIRNDGAFWFPISSDWRPRVRDRSNASITLQKAEMIAAQEIALAIEEALTTNGRLPREQVAIAVSRLFGFQRTGSDLRQRIDTIISDMIKKGLVLDEAGQIRHKVVNLAVHRPIGPQSGAGVGECRMPVNPGNDQPIRASYAAQAFGALPQQDFQSGHAAPALAQRALAAGGGDQRVDVDTPSVPLSC